ncbi:hypothetical protein MUP32_06990 [Candidatus Microgenomates bacterium]|nr:hypothetical protein [Candidatus Microgenomates bacterium]
MRKIVQHPHFIPWFLFIVFASIYFSSTVGVMNSMDAPQYAMTQALVEKNTIQIDSFNQWSWPDYCIINDHIYNCREPGQSFLGIPFYLLAKAVLPLVNSPYQGYPDINEDSKLEALTYGFFSTIGVLSVILLWGICRKLKISKAGSLFAAFLFGIGSLLWRYSFGYVRQSPAVLLYLSFIYVILYKPDRSKEVVKWFLLGLITGVIQLFDSVSFLPLFLTGILYLLFKKIRRKKSICYLFVAFILPVLFMIILRLVYNKIAFGDYLSEGRFISVYAPIPLQYQFSAEAKKTIPYLLFSFKSLPPTVLDYMKNLPQDMAEKLEYGLWATKNKFLGIFIQSPILFLFFPGIILLFRRNRRLLFMILLIIGLNLIIIGKFMGFYNPNSYDTRYLLPVIPLLFISVSYCIDSIFRSKKKLIIIVCSVIAVLLALLSIYNSWYSVITSYSPHISGENRFSFYQLAKPWGNIGNAKNNAALLFINTFPNIYNLHILFIFYLVPLLGIFLLRKLFQSLLATKR